MEAGRIPKQKRGKDEYKTNGKEIIKAIKIEAEIPLQSAEGYKDLIKFVKKLFKEYREGIMITDQECKTPLNYLTQANGFN